MRDINVKLEEEAQKLSEEKGLPFEYVKQMLEFMERETDTVEIPVKEKTHSRPIPEKIAMFWVNESIDIFRSIMPPLAVPFPPVYTATASSFTKVRNKIVKEIQCPHKEVPDTSIMEYIHGKAGNAILIRRELIADLPVHDDRELHYYFQHFIWHELGHFYAINSEKDDLYRYNDPGLTDNSFVYDPVADGCGFSSQRKKQEGYWFWQEFIAEAISNHVSYVIRSQNENYQPNLIEWTADVWEGIVNQLSEFLENTLYYYTSTIDEYSLAHYFAKLLTDDLTQEYIKAANEGKLKNQNGVYTIEKIEPTCISDLPKYYQPHLWKMQNILLNQLRNKEFWIINENTLEELGSCIGNMMVVKIKELAGEFPE